MNSYLVDVNVWLALAVNDHVHHRAARTWFEEPEDSRILFCRVTQAAFLRLLTNRKVLGASVLTGEQAWEAYDVLMEDSRVRFAGEPLHLQETWRATTAKVLSQPNFWTDAYLAAFALAGGHTLVTFDAGFQRAVDMQLRLLAS